MTLEPETHSHSPGTPRLEPEPSDNRRRKIAVVGCGALGSFYGAGLVRAGHHVHFLLRSDYDHVRQHGVRVESPGGDFHVRPFCANSPAAIGICDLVLVGLKTTANRHLPDLLPPLIGPETVVVSMQNGLGNEEELSRLVSPRQVIGGLCFVCLNRVAPGFIRHMAHGLIVLGEFVPNNAGRLENLAQMFRDSGVPCQTTDNLGRARWEKLTWNIPFNGLGVAGAAGLDAVLAGRATHGVVQPCLTTDLLISDHRWLRIVRELMFEVVSGAKAAGFNIPAEIVETQLERTRSMGPYKASTLLDFEHRIPLELHSMFLEPLARATAAGASMPWLERICSVLTDLEQSGLRPET
jgi:2-dehydropantoate 2-reductase